MRFPANCLVVAVVCGGLGLRAMRNRSGRLHFYWVRGGRAYEFYSPGASRCTYLRNAIRLGAVRRCPSLDEIA